LFELKSQGLTKSVRIVKKTPVSALGSISHRIPRRHGAAVAVLALSAFLCSACSRSAEYYLKKGNELYAAGKSAEASINYRRAIQQNPKLGEPYYKLGLTQLKLQNMRGAFEALGRAVQLSPDREDFKVAYGDLCLAGYISNPARPQNLYQIVSRISDELLAKDANSFSGLRMKGYLAILESRPADAAGYFQRASQQRPDQPDVAVSLVNSLLLDRREAAAERVARQYIQGHKNYGTAYDVLFAYYASHNQPAQAEDILKLKVANNPDEPGYISQLAHLYWSGGKQSHALDLLAGMVEKPKYPAQAHLVAGDFYGSIAHWDQAKQQFELGLAAAPDQKLLFQKRIVNLLLAQGSKTEAGPLVDTILKEAPQDEEAFRIRAGLRLDSGQADLIRAAAEDYKSLLQKHNTDPKLHYTLGQARQRLSEFAMAKAEYREAIRLQTTYLAPHIGMIEIAFAERKLEEAVRLADELISVQPQNTQARLLKAVALRELRRYADARAELQHVLQTAPKDGTTYLQLGLIEIEQKNYAKAEAAFKKLQDLGGDAGATYGLAVMYSVRGQLDKANELLKRELERFPKNQMLHELVAAIAIQAHDYDRAAGEYRVLIAMTPSNKTFYFQLAEALRVKGETNGYISTLEQAQKLFPRDLSPTLVLASALDGLGRRDAAIQQYRRAMELQPDDPRVLNNLAFAMVETSGNLDEALRMAQRAVQRVPDQPVFVDTLGWIYVKRKMTDSAVQVLDSVVKKQPNNPVFCYHFGVALLQKGDLQRAKATLEDALAKKPSPEYADKIRQLLAHLG
jgi:tetratricopeptide (TPR) repeat protein